MAGHSRAARHRLTAALCAAAASACTLLPDVAPPQALTEPELARLVASLALEPSAQVVIAVADIARCEELEPAYATAAIAAAVMAAAPSSVVITMGDHAYEDATSEEFEQCYGPTWGRFAEVTFPSPGNHDLETAGGQPYFDYFPHYRRDRQARARGYYSFERGGWLFASLNSLRPMERGSRQLEWLEATLARSAHPCTLAYWHHPRVSSGWHGLWPWDRGRDTDDAWGALHAHGAEVVVNGHDHIYERFAPQDANLEASDRGIRQFTAGTGGGRRQPAPRRRPNSEALYSEGYGVLVLTLHARAYEWAFVGADGVVHDGSTGPLPCH